MKKLIINSTLFLALFAFTGTCFAYYGAQPRKEYRDNLGRLQGYSQRNPYTNETNHYDNLGRIQGSSKTNPYTNETNHYDSLGRLQGTTKYSQW